MTVVGPAQIISSGVDGVCAKSPPSTPIEDLTTCCRPTHVPEADYNVVCQIHAPGLDLESEAEKLMADEWPPGSLLYDLLDRNGATDIDCGPWMCRDALSGGWSSRVVRAMLVMPSGPMLPKTAQGIITYWVSVERGDDGHFSSLRIEADFLLEGVPYCECFFVHERHTFTSSPLGGGAPSFVKEFGLVFKARTFAKPMIQSNSLSTQLKTGEFLKEFLLDRGGGDQATMTTCTAGSLGSGSSPSDKCSSNDDSLTLEVWELQRRVTLFHSSWLAPFLPHDGVKRWRWVDMEYQQHALVKAGIPRSIASESERPEQVIGIPSGWTPHPQGWSVVDEDPDNTDEDGWQYAVDFYLGSARWGKSPDWHHCRRRKWAITYERSLKEQQSEGEASPAEKLTSRPASRLWAASQALLGPSRQRRGSLLLALFLICQLLSPEVMLGSTAVGWLRLGTLLLLSGLAALAAACAFWNGGPASTLLATTDTSVVVVDDMHNKNRRQKCD